MPGVLTALMGGSGAGKTTLMDVLAGRKTEGVITGDVSVNGHPKQQETWARVVGYVEQTDVHSAGLTVEESLRCAAGFCCFTSSNRGCCRAVRARAALACCVTNMSALCLP